MEMMYPSIMTYAGIMTRLDEITKWCLLLTENEINYE